MVDEKVYHKTIPLTGKLVTADPATIGQNFQTLTNMRYTDTHVKGVQGMTKINTTALTTYLKTRNAFHFKKSQPAESHVLAQVYNTGLTASQVLRNAAVIPAQGDFEATALWTDSTGAGRGYFSDAPDGQIIYCNGVDVCIWGGLEMKTGAFITSTAAITDTGSATNPKDYTDIVNNTKTDGDNVIIIGGGIDTYTGLMLHGDGVDAAHVFTDSSTAGAAKTVDEIADAQIDTAWAAFGTGSILFDGTGDGLTTADHADFYPASSAVTYDEIVYFNALPAANQAMILFSQRADASNSAIFYLKNYGGVYSFTLMLKTSGVVAYPIKDLVWTTPVINTKYHIALIRGWSGTANSWTVCINGVSLGAATLATAWPNVAATFQIGAGTTEVVSTYPPASSATYIKATSEQANYEIWCATDPAKSLTGTWVNNNWLSTDGVVTNQRVHIDLGAVVVVKRIYYENGHNGGSTTDQGVKTFTFWGSNTAAAFAELTYATDTNWTQLTASHPHFEQHVAADTVDPQYLTVTNTTAYRYYAFKFADNYGNASRFGVRRIGLNPASAIAYNGHMDEIRWSHTAAAGGIARWTANFTPPTRPYAPAARTWLVGTIRPLQAQKYYVSNGNKTASTMTGKVWNGNTWQTLTITDNTDTGASLAATGTVTFASTVSIAKPKYLEGYYLYWYQFSIDAGEVEIYQVTLDAPFQPLVDMWDGVFRDVMRFYEYKAAYLDNTINVLKEDYDSATASSYYAVGGLAAFSTPNNCLEIGFAEKAAGLRIGVAVPNTTAATVASIDYWDGTAYVSAGTITDGTSEGAISIAKTGVITWNNNSLANETKKVVSNSPPLYYYRLKFDQAIVAGARINYIGGITAQKTMSYYKFPVFAQGRILLCADMSEAKNKAVCSAKYMPQVYNGIDSVDIYFGEEEELTCGTELFSQYGSSLYSLILMFKDNETWIMAGQDIDQWENNIFLLSSSIGCPAPLTLKTINLAAEPGAGINRSLAIWQGANGIYMSDGRAPIPIHGDIKELFDPTDSRCITASKIGDSIGWIDPLLQEYHWLSDVGEWVYDIHRNRWWEAERVVDLQCGVLVHDTDGNAYNYGFLDTGYMERLENGTTFDGNDIVHTLQFGDMALADLAFETRLSKVKLIVKAKTTTTTVSCTHYANGCTTGATAKTMSPARSGHRIAMPEFTHRLNGLFHSLKFVSTADTGTIIFEPLAVASTHGVVRED